MADEKKVEEEAKAKADAENVKTDEKLDKLLSCMDAVVAKVDASCARMDAFEEREKTREDASKKDAMSAEEIAADKAKKDAEEEAKKRADAEKAEKEEEDKRKNDARIDADETRKRIDAIEAKLPKERTDSDLSVMTDAQAKADAVYHAFGSSAPRFLNGEDNMSYRRRLVREFQTHSPAWKAVDLAVLADAKAFEIAENSIYADAMAAARDPRGVENGGLRMVTNRMESGHIERSFFGRPSAWMSRFAGSKRYVTRIDPSPRKEIA